MRVRLLGGAALVLALLWSGGWFAARHYADGEIDPALARLAARGITVDCPSRSYTGYPLALAVSCTDATVTLADGTRAHAARIEAGAAVTDWSGIALRLTAPFEIAPPNRPAVKGETGDLAATVRFASGRPTAIEAETDGLAVTLAGGGEPARIVIGKSSLAVRLDGEAVRLTAFVAGLDAVAGKPVLPAPADIEARLGLEGGAALLAGADPADWAANGGKLVIDRFDVGFGKAHIEAQGEASVGPDGLVDAGIDTYASSLDGLPAAAKAAGRSLNTAFAGLGMAYMLMGKTAEDGRRSIRVDVVDGVVSAGGREVSELPPLF